MKRILILLALAVLALCGCLAHATVTNQSTSVTYTCTGSTGPFPFTFPISDPTALTVTQNGSVLATTAYTVTPVNNNYNNGGSVNLNAACPSAQVLILQRITPILQKSVFTDNMPIPMKSFENGLDKLTEIDQEQQNTLSNAFCPANEVLQSIFPLVCVSGGGGGGAGNPAGPSYAVNFANNLVTAFQGDSQFTFDPTSHVLTGNVNQTLNVQTFGAVGDAASTLDGVMTSGSPNLSSASTPWGTCPTGKTISVQYAGGTGGSNQPLKTTVVSCTDSGHIVLGANATQNASAAGVIWGTNNYTAFSNWAAALPGNAGLVPAGNYLIDNAGTLTVTLGSNEDLTMNRNGAIYFVGANISSGTGLFSIPSGTSNLKVDRFHIIGEWQNTANVTGVGQAYGWAAAFAFGNSSTSSHHIQITNGLFDHLLGIAVQDFGPADYDIDVENNSLNHDANEGINVNAPQSIISGNFFNFDGFSACIESSSAQSQINNNTCINAGGSYAMAVGGLTSGSPYLGTQVTGNLILNPASGYGCMSIGDGFAYGTISNNLCLGLTISGQFGFSNSYTSGSGYPSTGNNIFIGNGVTGTTGLALAFFDNEANNNIYRDNWTDSTVNGLTVSGSTGVNSAQNTWNYLHLEVSSSGRFQDFLLSGVYTFSGGSAFSNDTVLYGPAGIVYSGPPASVFSTTVSAPGYTTASGSSGNATTTPFKSTSGITGGYGITRLAGPGGATNLPYNSVVDFGNVGSGTNNFSHTWCGAEYNQAYSSDFSCFTAMVGNSAFSTYQSIRAFTLSTNSGNTYAYGNLNGSLCVGAVGSCSDPGTGSIGYLAYLQGPASAPTGSCTGQGWVFSQDGVASWCGASINTWVQPFGAGSRAIALTGSFVGKPANAQIFGLYAITSNIGTITVPANCTGALAYAKVAATASTVMTVSDYPGGPGGSPSVLCSFTWAISGTVATISGAGGTINAGDMIEFDGQATADLTLASFTVSMAGTH